MDYKQGYDKLPPTPLDKLLMLPCGNMVRAIIEELETIRIRRDVLEEELARLYRVGVVKDATKKIKVRKARVLKVKVERKPRRQRLVLLPLED